MIDLHTLYAGDKVKLIFGKRGARWPGGGRVAYVTHVYDLPIREGKQVQVRMRPSWFERTFPEFTRYGSVTLIEVRPDQIVKLAEGNGSVPDFDDDDAWRDDE